MPKQSWNADNLRSLAGATVMVTGASSGLGAECVRHFARAGARVVLAVRNVEKGRAIAKGIDGVTEVRHLDVASLESVRTFAEEWSDDIDILVNNAGIMQVPFGKTADGFELQMGTNHLGHFALTNLLLPHITNRVVVVSSELHKQSKLDLDDLNWSTRPYKSLTAYRDSKLANVLFVAELQRRLKAAGRSTTVVCAHPGLARTSLVDHVSGPQAVIGRLVGRLVGQSVEAGALPILYAATENVPGASYVGPNGFAHLRGAPEVGEPSPSARDTKLAARLWDLSASLTATDFALR
jgi:NAD(P)-dependent dehydrogenase (short-subunit alcohol dehydrogenase family)